MVSIFLVFIVVAYTCIVFYSITKNIFNDHFTKFAVKKTIMELISVTSEIRRKYNVNVPPYSVNEINLMTAVRNCGQKDTMELVTVELAVNSTQMPHQHPFQIQEGEGVYFHFHWKVN